MAVAGLIRTFRQMSLITIKPYNPPLLSASSVMENQVAQYEKLRDRRTKKPHHGYRHYPLLPKEYTTDPIPVQKLGGRDPKTGRVVVRTLGGGIKYSYYWVDTKRDGPVSGPPAVEKVHQIRSDFCRTAHIALVAANDKKRWILATENMKEGDLIYTSKKIPRIAVRPVEGNSHPLGALPMGTLVHNIEMFPGEGGLFVRAAGSAAQVLRKVDGHVVVQLPSKREVSLSENCMATIGRVSNIGHSKVQIGSAQANRWLGNRPHRGLWHRKDGYCGRKIRPIPPMKVYDKPQPKPSEPYQLTL